MLAVAVLIPILLNLAACRYEIGKLPGPSPTPSPTPTPTPTPVLDSTSVTTLSTGSSVSAPLSLSVAQAEADYFENATATAAEEAQAVRRTLTRTVTSVSDASENLDEAKASLSTAADAYHKAEATVFFVDPDSVEELRAQPDPLRAGAAGQGDDMLSGLADALDKVDDELSRPLSAAKAAALLLEAKDIADKAAALEVRFRGLADAWKGGVEDNFRGRYFLSSPEGAIARVFQGLLAMTGDILPGRLSSSADDSTGISQRLRAVREIYLGDAESPDARPALHHLVQEASPVQAALTRASIARAAALAGVLEITPGDAGVRAQLGVALEDLTRQLVLAAQSLGISIVSGEGD